jgi:hypothetical protein
MNKLVATKYNTLKLIISHLSAIFILKYINSPLYSMLYDFNLLKRFKLNDYYSPKFVKKFELFESYSKNESRLKELLTAQFLNNFRNEVISNKNYIKKSGLVVFIIPEGWINSSTSQGKIQGPVIMFYVKGLEKLGLSVELIETNKEKNYSFETEKTIRQASIVFIFSLTGCKAQESLFQKILSKNSDYQQKIVGFITSPLISEEQVLELSYNWSQIVDFVLYFEDEFDLKQYLSKFFNVKFFPYLQYTPENFTYFEKFTTSVHISCRIKQNRLAWIFVAKYQLLRLNIPYYIRVISDPIVKLTKQANYLSIDEVTSSRRNFGFGFVMSHRNSIHDTKLLASFWDYYRLGVIPIVQMQNHNTLALNMVPFLDYFPVTSDKDLFNILKFSIEFPGHFEKCRSRIISRMQNEFNPTKITELLLKDLE